MRGLITNERAKTLLLVVSLAFNLGLCVAMAVERHAGQKATLSRGESGRHREPPMGELGLSPEQTEIVSASREKLFEELHALKRRLHEESELLAGVLTASELDGDAVTRQVETVAAVRNEIQWRMVQHLLGIREVLEPDQLESFKEFAGRVLFRSERGGPPHGGRPDRGAAGPQDP